MLEQDWLTSTDPQAMLIFLRGNDKLSVRKGRLFAVAFCRHLDLLTDDSVRSAVELVEHCADREAANDELKQSATLIWFVTLANGVGFGAQACGDAALATITNRQADILRDIVGPLPFRPLPALPAAVLSWNDGLVVNLARTAYEASGQLDPARLAVLCDALLDAGLPADHEFLVHLRLPESHWRGCFALDAILGRE
jgi:hypothetical protein